MKTSTADTWFSRYIRLRDAQESNGVLYVKCCTCNTFRNPKYVDNGHYCKRQHKGTRFVEKNCAPQCKPCNGFNQGEDEKFAKYIDGRYGEGTAQELKAISRKVTKLDENVIAMYYKAKVAELIDKNRWGIHK